MLSRQALNCLAELNAAQDEEDHAERYFERMTGANVRTPYHFGF